MTSADRGQTQSAGCSRRCGTATASGGTAHEGLDRLRAEALDYELMGEEYASISCSQLLAWVFDALAEREELRDELAYLRRGE